MMNSQHRLNEVMFIEAWEPVTDPNIVRTKIHSLTSIKLTHFVSITIIVVSVYLVITTILSR